MIQLLWDRMYFAKNIRVFNFWKKKMKMISSAAYIHTQTQTTDPGTFVAFFRNSTVLYLKCMEASMA